MYVTVDKDGMHFVHAHPDYRVCSALANIELAHVAVSVQPCEDANCFRGYTDLELHKLYQSATGSKFPGYSRPHLQQAVSAAAMNLPVTDATLADAVAQSQAVAGDKAGRYRYVKGALRPAPVDELWQVTTLRSSVCDPAQLAAQGAALAAAVPTPAPPAPAPPRPAQAPARAAPSTPAAGSVTDRIFAACDTVLAGLPLPHDRAACEQARKLAIPLLEAAGVNINSARKGSSMWVQSKS